MSMNSQSTQHARNSDPSLCCTRHLGGTITRGSAASGTRYASHSVRKAHTSAWLQIQVYAAFPHVPSLAGSRVQMRQDLASSTKGAGEPVSEPFFLEFELFDDESPKACANFRRLCAGQTTSRMGQSFCYQGLTPSYRGTYFHKVIPGFIAQGGDITMRVTQNGYNYHSSAGRGWFDDENKRRRHNEAGLLSMANNGPNSNGTQFFITTSAKHEQALNSRHVCFGRVVAGLDTFLAEVAPFGNTEGYPSRYAVIIDCGEGAAPAFEDTFGATGNQAPPLQEQEQRPVHAPVGKEAAGAETGDFITPLAEAVLAANDVDASELVTDTAAEPLSARLAPTPPAEVPLAGSVNRVPSELLEEEVVDDGTGPVEPSLAVGGKNGERSGSVLALQPMKSALKKGGGGTLDGTEKHVRYNFE